MSSETLTDGNPTLTTSALRAGTKRCALAPSPAPSQPPKLPPPATSPIPPIHTLPDEVLAAIFSYLSQRDILRRVLPVCRRWQAVAQSHVLSRELIFCFDYYLEYAVPTEEAVRLIRNIPNLKSLQLRRRLDTVQLLQAVGSSCTELQRLEVDCWNEAFALTPVLLAVFRSSSEHLADLALKCVDIGNTLPFCNGLGTALPNLRRLTISSGRWFGWAELNALLNSCSLMQAFRTDCHFSDVLIRRMVQHWGSSLQELKLGAWYLSDNSLAPLAGCTQLSSLELEHLGTFGSGLLQLVSLDHLEHFGLLQSDRVESQSMQAFFWQSRSAGRLREINLGGCTGVDNGVLFALTATCPSVEDVNVAFCRHVNAAGVRKLLRSCRRLLRLNVMETDSSVAQVLAEIPGWLLSCAG